VRASQNNYFLLEDLPFTFSSTAQSLLIIAFIKEHLSPVYPFSIAINPSG